VDNHKNFATSLVATAPSPATSGTSLAVTSGDGANFPLPPFNAVVGPANTLLLPTLAEVVRVTARATDTFTITRTQEGSSARTIVVGDMIHAGPTAKWFTDIESVALAAPRPGPDGFISRNYDQSFPGQSVSATGSAGVIYLARVEVPDQAMTITNMHVILGTAATSPTNAWIGLYDSSGTRQMLSANQAATGAWTSTTTPVKTIPGASAWSKPVTNSDFCWVAILTGAATAMPGFQRAINSTAANGLSSGATARWGTIGASQTSLPTTLTSIGALSTIAITNVTNWVALS
jgi:hypothetical protein